MAADDDIIDPEELELDDGMPNFSKPKEKKSINLTIILIIASVIIILLIVYLSQDDEPQPEPLDGTDFTKTFSITNTLGETPKIPVLEPKKSEALSIKAIPGNNSIMPKDEFNSIFDIQELPKKTKEGQAAQNNKSRKIKKGILHYNSKESFMGLKGLSDKLTIPDIQKTNNNNKSPIAKTLRQELRSTKTNSAIANRLINRDMFITKGAFLDCVLETALNSTLSGMISCRLTNNVYSTSGKVLLLERGSRVTGEYQGGLKNGQARIFAIWSRIETPSGVLIDIQSPGTDPLGRTGHDGYIETFFWKKFGAAILLSFIDDASKAITSRIRKALENQNQVAGLVDSNGNYSQLPAKALENSIDIPPVLTKNQGDHISIFVVRDLDFRSVYELKAND